MDFLFWPHQVSLWLVGIQVCCWGMSWTLNDSWSFLLLVCSRALSEGTEAESSVTHDPRSLQENSTETSLFTLPVPRRVTETPKLDSPTPILSSMSWRATSICWAVPLMVKTRVLGSVEGGGFLCSSTWAPDCWLMLLMVSPPADGHHCVRVTSFLRQSPTRTLDTNPV